MSEFLQVLAFSFSVTGPIFVLLALGVLLRRTEMLTDAFVDTGSRLVFNVMLPALLFISVAANPLEETANPGLVIFGLLATLVAYLILEFLAARYVQPARDRGVVVQGGFRGNLAIIGLAYCMNAYGDVGVVTASLYVGMVTILYNVLAVITLQRSLAREGGGWLRMLRGIARNPLILSILAGLAVAGTGLPLPKVIEQSLRYLANVTVPLALLCAGASLDFRSMRSEFGSALFASVAKLVVVPLFFVLAGVAVGFRGVELGVLLLLSSAPTAAASYVMVRAMGGNATLAASIIALTTAGSLVATSVAVTILRAAGLI
ncbi:AEC family transporter [Pseudothauera nasutitermitis]|uniref:AEC family transporter n=1 Tax=Pseudothauera nasutitermitis TaxID=2565930 RepID=A0A4S4AXZ8_9RHOO|nr:AEC family transporter [Pseudothauera nasutitermitis]THF64506.1 AEC family transporter [Pseudothauera nasutitermitis]